MPADHPPTAVSCPPHHWLIDDEPLTGKQRWGCARCGLVRSETPRPAEARPYFARAAEELGKDESFAKTEAARLASLRERGRPR